jgi:hypothetical protein
MIKLSPDARQQFIECYRDRSIRLEGNIVKIIDTSEDAEFAEYIRTCVKEDNEQRTKRLEITKKVQAQNIELQKGEEQYAKVNKELTEALDQNKKINEELKKALDEAESAKQNAENDLDVLQKKTQYELIGSIVKVSLWIVCGVGVVTTLLFAMVLWTKTDNKIVESAWSNMFGILLTNSFSIIGTIMGVKYASDRQNRR